VAGPRRLVDGPRLTPPTFGLLSVAELRGADTGDTHWQNGISFETECPNLDATAGTTYDECIAVTGVGSPSPPTSKADNTNYRWRGATPFTVYSWFDCSPVGLDQARNKARTALEKTESWQIERAFWTGRAAGTANIAFPHLAHSAAEIVDAQNILLQSPAVTGVSSYPASIGPWPIQQGLGIAEKLLGDCAGGQGVIHVPPQVLPKLAGAMAVTSRGAQLTTSNGNLLAVGSGYPGTGPGGQSVTQDAAWIYATGPVVVYRGDVRVSNFGADSLDRGENTMRLLAERTVLAAWDCCHFAVQINLTV
jgi:hypothetical protein